MKFFFILIAILFFYCDAEGQDQISVKAIPHPCMVLDNPKEFKVISENAIVMTAGKETDLHIPADASYDRHNAPKFLFKPDTDFDLSARIKPSFDQLYDGGAILVYSDRDNWAKILVQNAGGKPLIGNSVVKDKVTDDSYFNVDQKDIYLRVTKNLKVFRFYASRDGKEWTLVREFLYHKPENVRIGFYSQSPIGSQCAVEYSEIRYTGTKR